MTFSPFYFRQWYSDLMNAPKTAEFYGTEENPKFPTREEAIQFAQSIESEMESRAAITKQNFGKLLGELPKDVQVFKSADGQRWTAESMMGEIERGSDVANQYFADVMRVTRDFLARSTSRAD